MLERDGSRIANATQIDSRVPGHEHPDVVVERGANRVGEDQSRNGRQACPQRIVVRVGEGR
jgi:hypothetical protein